MPENSPHAAALTETLSEKEAIFEKWRNTVGLFLGPLAALAVYLIVELNRFAERTIPITPSFLLYSII